MAKLNEFTDKVTNEVDRIIDAGRYSDLITYSGLFAGHYDLEAKLVNDLLYYTEHFSTALDYDTATDTDLWNLVVSYVRDGQRPPVVNQKKAHLIANKSQWLHHKFPKNQYFNKYSFLPVSREQSGRLKQYIHKIMSKYGLNGGQFKEFHSEFMQFIYDQENYSRLDFAPVSFKVKKVLML